jgi:phosphatidylserine/phosphatidylglycerophosphate/cardiolipin synthase-like enzyme
MRKGTTSIWQILLTICKLHVTHRPANKLRVQVLRSASHWSIGLRKRETSIHYAYVQNILLAKRFIYIENQFFLSATKRSSRSKKGIKNSIIKAIFYRIKQAILENEPFKVIVFIPLLPAFEGKLDEGRSQGIIMQVQMGRANSTIGVGVHSLLARLRKITNKPEEYIVFCSLRTFDPKKPQLMDNLGLKSNAESAKTNLIYIHSKVVYSKTANDSRRSKINHRKCKFE